METIEQEISINSQPKISRREAFWAAISYLGILVLLPFSLKKRSDFINYHLQQGLTLLIIEIILTCIFPIPFLIWLSLLGWLFCGIFSLFGFIEALRKRLWPLPLVSKLSKKIKL
jgi:uncharacterized membrane protein